MNQFAELSQEELLDTDGGFVITGAMIATGIGCLAGGVAVGYAVGTVIEYFTK